MKLMTRWLENQTVQIQIRFNETTIFSDEVINDNIRSLNDEG